VIITNIAPFNIRLSEHVILSFLSMSLAQQSKIKRSSKMKKTHHSFGCLVCRRQKMPFNIRSTIFCLSKSYVRWRTTMHKEELFWQPF